MELEPIEQPSRGAAPSAATPVASAAFVMPADNSVNREDQGRFLAAAIREHEAGWIDRPLWEWVLAQSGGDEAKTKDAYMRARATVLRLAKRDQQPQAVATSARPQPEPAAQFVPPDADRVASRAPAPKRGVQLALATLCVFTLIAAGAWWIGGNRPTDLASLPGAASAPAHPVQSLLKSPAAHATPAPAVDGNSAAPVDDGLKARIAKVGGERNWNVLVLLASEWTRREPANVRSWIQLSVGYTGLRQFGEALEAANKATQVAPGDARAWRNLAHVHVALNRPADALAAFEKTVALDGRDVQSLVQVGMLNAQLAHLPQAQAAFEKAANASPEDVGAWCGQALIARQQGRSKDADAIVARLQSQGRGCEDWNAQVSVAKAAGQPGTR